MFIKSNNFCIIILVSDSSFKYLIIILYINSLILKLFEPELFICLNKNKAKAIRSSLIHPKLTSAYICAVLRIFAAQILEYTSPKSTMAGV